MGGTPPYGYDLRYENAAGQFLFIVRFMPDGSKQLLDENRNLIRILARGESLNISKRDQAKLTLSNPERVKVVKQIFQTAKTLLLAGLRVLQRGPPDGGVFILIAIHSPQAEQVREIICLFFRHIFAQGREEYWPTEDGQAGRCAPTGYRTSPIVAIPLL